MNLFSKDKLLKAAGAAKKHWWLFVPMLLLLMLGYFIFSVADALQILLLHNRNFFLAIAMLIRRCARGIALFFSNTAKSIGSAAKRRGEKISKGWQRCSENAAIARSQLLNSAVEYCTDKVQRRQEKKQRLNQIAKELRSDTKPEITAAEITAAEPKTV